MEETHEITDLITEEQQRKLQNFNLAVHKTKGALFFAGGVSLIPMIILYSKYSETIGVLDILPFVFMFLTFLGLTFFASKKPHTALIIAAVVYMGYILLMAALYSITNGISGFLHALYSGCLFKIIILTILGKAASLAKSMQKVNEEVKLDTI